VGNNGHVFSDSDDSSESDEEEEVVFEHMEGGGDNLKLEFEREALAQLVLEYIIVFSFVMCYNVSYI
jgi:hypothetical protein